ncbi:MAG: hypothetical protein ACM3QZ_10035 [Solirubrobacterales bacterium]
MAKIIGEFAAASQKDYVRKEKRAGHAPPGSVSRLKGSALCAGIIFLKSEINRMYKGYD